MRRFGRGEFRHRRLDGALLLPILGRCGLQRQHARAGKLGRHVGEHPLNRLVVRNRLTELLALVRVADGLVERRFADSQRLGGDRDPPALERPHREPESLIHLAEDVSVARRQVEIEVHAPETADAERIGARRTADARRVHRHEKRRDALTAEPGPRAREEDRDGCLFGVRHPHLPAGDAIAIARAHGHRFLVRRIGAGVRFGKREGTDRSAARQRPEPAFTLPIAPRMGDYLRDERVGHRQRYRDGRARLRDGFNRERVAHIVAPRPAPRSGNRDPEQPVRGGRVHHVRGVLARLVDPRRPLRDDLARELLDGGLEGLLDVCELENHKGEEWNAEPAELAEIIPVSRALRALRSDFVLR